MKKTQSKSSGNPQTERSDATASAARHVASQILRKMPPQERATLLGLPKPMPTPEERNLAGVYRVTHGRIAFPRLQEDIQADKARGIENPPKQFFAEMGDVVRLGDKDAALMVDAGVVETLDAKPSMVGKLWKAPEPRGSFFDRNAQAEVDRNAAELERSDAKKLAERESRDEQIRRSQKRLAATDGG
jgi:hypothetical protein